MKLVFDTYLAFYIKTYTAVFAVYECVLFFIFEKLKKRKIIRFFAYMLIAMAHLMLSFYLIGSGWTDTGTSFVDWFYVNTSEVGEVVQYDLFLVVGLGFFIVSVLYYFTCYRYRIFGVMLVTLFPFVIYGKRSEGIPTIWLTVMMTVFLAMMVHQRLVTDETKKSDLVIDPSYVIGAALFITTAGALTMLLPKPQHYSQLEEGTGIFRFDYRSNKTDYDDLNDVSSPRFGADASGEALFTVKTTAPQSVIYIRRQSFDVFRNDQWELSKNYNTYYGLADGEENEVNSPAFVYRLMKDLAETGRYEEFGITPDKFGNYGEFAETAWMDLRSDSYSPSYVPAPLMARIDALTYCDKNAHGEVNYSSWYNTRYRGLGVSYSYYPEDEAEYSYLTSLGLTHDRFLRFLAEAYANGDITPEMYSNFLRIDRLYTDTTGVSEEVAQLGRSITKGYEYDYEKAEALVDYFVENGFVYDEFFQPDDESIEYFLFESKTGVCSSYATAMAMMARAAGMPARYVEGFAAYEKLPDGSYQVRDSHAHAYVEVYLAGIGWVSFDPTVPGYMTFRSNNENNNGANNQALMTFMDYLSRIILFLIVVFVLIFIVLLDRIIELCFRTAQLFRKTDSRRITALYKRIVRLLELSSGRYDNIRGHTPHEMIALAAGRSADIRKAAELFEKVCFGSYEPTAEEYKLAYKDYKKSWKALAGKIRKRNKTHKAKKAAV
ncbi:MAG: DUF4129 domain-containing protein [Ruminococcus sp.]|nr:DUF4129 domain-containing protein [Ruminococcus sp.]